MTRRSWQLDLAFVLGISLVAGFLVRGYLSMKGKAEAHDTAVAEAASLKGDVEALKTEQARLADIAVTRAELSNLIRSDRRTVVTRLDKVTHESPDAAAYLGERIPDSVRDAYAD